MTTREKYRDIIDLSRPPVPLSHPRMSLDDRAKIFSPYAALRGYDEEIDAQIDKQSWGLRTEVSPEDQARLEETLGSLRKGMIVTITHFVSMSEELGVYRTDRGVLLSLDPIACTLRIRALENQATDSPAPSMSDAAAPLLASVKSPVLRKGELNQKTGWEKEAFTTVRFEDILNIEFPIN